LKTNPILLEVFKNQFASIAEEMGVTLNRTSFSPNIKERRDFSCAVFDAHGHLVAQAAHIPVHLGSMPMSVQAALEHFPPVKDEMIILNDPFHGGTHLPDITMIAPVFFEDEPLFFVANRVHHADVGGMTPGSMPISSSIFQEGIIIPPVRIIKQGKIDQEIMRLILNNVRTPEEREGDFSAQIMANITGSKRIIELMDKCDPVIAAFYANALIDYSEKITRKTIQEIPDGIYTFEDRMDDDAFGGEDIKIHVSIEIKADEAVIDFTKSDPQSDGNINAVYAITLSAVLYLFRAIIKEDIPANAGCFKPVRVITRQGSIVDANFPAAVAGGNVETSQRIVDALFGAMAKSLPGIIPAASQGTMNNLIIGGIDKKNNRPFTYYETIGGGMGAGKNYCGESAVHSHMTNTLNTPVEALEYSYPLLVTEYSIRKNSGGRGLFNGGDGIIRELKLLSDAEVTVISERRIRPPYGLSGGGPGEKGKNIIIKDGQSENRPGKFYEKLKENDIIRIETPGGGGYGKCAA